MSHEVNEEILITFYNRRRLEIRTLSQRNQTILRNQGPVGVHCGFWGQTLS